MGKAFATVGVAAVLLTGCGFGSSGGGGPIPNDKRVPFLDYCAEWGGTTSDCVNHLQALDKRVENGQKADCVLEWAEADIMDVAHGDMQRRADDVAKLNDC